jgi:uncharacterized protein
VVVLGLILSLAIGLSLAFFGGGGSLLTMPVLHYVFLVPVHDAVAMSLVVVAVTSAAALMPHARAGLVDWKLGAMLGAASMAAAYIGGRLGALLPARALLAAFALVMLGAGTAMLLRARTELVGTSGRPGRGRIIAIGLGIGFLTGTLGAGGGFVIVPALTLFGGLAMREAVATSLFVIVLNSMTGLAGTLQHASFDSRLAAAVTTFAVAGTFIGARAAKHISVPNLKAAFGWFVIAVGVFVLARELW